MKITQEVRDFAAKQEAGLLNASVSDADAEQGMAQMSKRFEEAGGEIYLPTDSRMGSKLQSSEDEGAQRGHGGELYVPAE
jgi:hypothetical protein